MVHRAKQKRQPELIYRSRQANRTDIEELLGPNFDPSQAHPFPAPEPSTVPEITDNKAYSSLIPDRNLLLDSSSPPDSSLRPAGNLLPDSCLPTGGSLLTGSALLSPDTKENPTSRSAFSRLPPDSNLLTDSSLLSGSELPNEARAGGGSTTPSSDLLHGSELPSSSEDIASSLLPDSDLLRVRLAGNRGQPTVKKANTSILSPGSSLLSGSQLRTGQGRIIHIREVRSVQDAHTKGEHDLLKEMWKRGREESPNTRVLKAGLSELSALCGSHKTSCRSYVRALIEKLALEEVETYQAAAGLQGARVYRIYSFDEIRNRRRRAGLTHVIRTGAVTFVDSRTGLKIPPVSNLLPDSRLASGGKLPPASNLPLESRSSLLSEPGSNLLSPSINNSEQEKTITSSSTMKATTLRSPNESKVVEGIEKLILESPYSEFDREAITTIVRQSRERVPDVTADEIFTLFQEKARTLIGNRRIENFTGILIWSWSGFFTPARVNALREAKRKQKEEEEKQREERIAMYRQMIDDPSTPEDWRADARKYLAEKGIHEGQAPE